MSKIFESASKIVFILMALAAVVGLFLKIISPDMFMVLAAMAFTHFFKRNGSGEIGK